MFKVENPLRLRLKTDYVCQGRKPTKFSTLMDQLRLKGYGCDLDDL